MYQKLKNHLTVAIALMVVGVLAMFAGLLLQQGKEGIHPVVWVGIALNVGSVVYKMFTLKCPHCGAFLPVKYKLPQVCLRCGKTLTEDLIHEEADT